MSRTGTPYHIAIDGKIGADMSLTPAADPFVTQEEGDADLFVPVRTQSGSINIVTDDVSVVRDIIPTDGGVRRVILYRNGTEVWRGYVQPQMLKMTLWRGPQEVSIPIECPLSALKYRSFNYFSTRTVTIGEVLGTILNNEFNDVIMQGDMLFPSGSDYSRAWLWKRLNTSLLKKEGRTEFDAIEDICSLFGWTARSFSDAVTFVFHRNTLAPITTIVKTDTYTLKTQGTFNNPLNWRNLTIQDGAAAGNSNRIAFYEGVKNAVVTCKTDVFDTEIDSPEGSQIALAVDDGRLTSEYHYREWVDSGEGFRERWWEDFPSGGGEVSIGEWYLSGYNVEFSLDKKGTTNIAEWDVGMNIQCTDTRAGNAGGPYTDLVEEHPGWLQFRTDVERTFTSGYLYVRGAQYSTVLVWIGDKVWDNANGRWTSDPTNVEPMSVSRPAVVGVGGMTGALKVKLFNDALDQVRKISQIKIEFTQLDADDYIPNTEIRHEASVGANFTGTKELTTNLCVYEAFLQRSENEIMNPNLTLCAGLYDSPSSGVAFNPLQRIADEAASELSKTGELVEITLLKEKLSAEIQPITRLYVASLGAYYYPVSISGEWRDDMVNLKIVRR